jgi:F-type H+-transporting ATPase subunit b
METLLSSFAVNFWWGLAAFSIFVLLLFKLGVTHILTAVDARDKKIAGELAEAEASYAKAKQIQADLDKQIRDIETKISEMMIEARRDAEVLKGKAIEQGRGELEAMRQRALAEIESARQTAIMQLRAEVADIATLVAEKILRTQLDAKKHEDLVLQAIETYEANRPVKG